MITDAIKRYGLLSIMDVGACWEVNGGYAFHALKNGVEFREVTFCRDRSATGGVFGGAIFPMTRTEIILQLVDRSGKGLEIGPSYNPVAPKSHGWDVEIVDHLDAEGLRKKYVAWGVDPSKIEAVDHVITEKSLAETVGKRDHFDFVIASHVIEHTPDLIGFLQDCQRMLKRGGILTLAVPDKRFCFDAFQSLTTTGMVFQAHQDGRKLHSAGTIFDAYANHVMLGDSVTGFDRDHPGIRLVHDIPLSLALTQTYIEKKEFVDTHAWNFTPSSFLLILQDLSEMALIDLGVASFTDTVGFEFFVSLRKGDPGQRKPRLEMLRNVSREQIVLREALDQANAANTKAHRYINALLTSTSRRLTTPLRGAVEALRRRRRI